MNPREIEESRQRLAAQVDEQKAKEAAGVKPIIQDHEARKARMLERDNIVDLGAALVPVMEILEKTAKEISEDADKYRALLAESKEECLCELCTCKLKPHWERTFYESRMASKLVIVWSSCHECDRKFSEALVNEAWMKMGIPEKLLGCTLENFECTTDQQNLALAKVKTRLDICKGFLIIRGKVGTGKSHLAVGVMKKYGKGLYVTEADLVGELRHTYDNKGGEQMIEKYRNARVLILDELTIHKGLDIDGLLYRILTHRYDSDKLTVITSNEELKTITDILGPRLTDRIRESLHVVTLEGESYRKRQ